MERDREPRWDLDKPESLSTRPSQPIDRPNMTTAKSELAAAYEQRTGDVTTPIAKKQAARENSIENASARRSLVIDGQPISSLTFSKRRSGPDAELRIDVRALSPDAKGAHVRRDLDTGALEALVGEDNARRIVQSKQRGGTLEGERLSPRDALETDAQSRRQQESLQVAKGRDEADREVAPAVKPGAGREEAPGGDRTESVAGSFVKSVSVQLELDMRAERALREVQLKAALSERFVQSDGEYRFRAEPAKIAFVDRGTRLTTQSVTPSVAQSMVDLAEAKGWSSLRVRGEEGFRRQVWMEASLRDVKVVGYEATPADREQIDRERAARQANSVEVASSKELPTERAAISRVADSTQRKQQDPSEIARTATGGQRQVLAVLQAALKVQNVDATTTLGVLREAEDRMTKMRDAGQKPPSVRIYDREAPREKPAKGQETEVVRERGARGR